MKTYEQTLTEMSNEQLLEEFDAFCIATHKDPTSRSHDRKIYSIEQEILKRMSAR